MSSATEQALNYESIPLSKRLQMVGTTGMTKNMKIPFDNIPNIPESWNEAIDIIDPNTGYTPLMMSSQNGTVATVRVLLSRGAKMEMKDFKCGYSALILASKYGHRDVAEELLRRGALTNTTDGKGKTALMHASKYGHLHVVMVLLKYGLSVNVTDESGWTALHFASKFGHKDITDYLVNVGAILGVKERIEGKTPLMLAAQYGRKETAIVLLDNGAFINAVSDIDGVTALMLASKEGHKGTVPLLLSRRAHVDMSDKYGWTALHFAASWGRKDIASILLSEEGNASIVDLQPLTANGDRGTTALIIATKASQIDVMRVLLNLGGANVDEIDIKEGKAALSYAAKLGLEHSVRCLLEYNADVNIRELIDGSTPLMLAASIGHKEIIHVFLNTFADLNFVDKNIQSAFDYAESSGFRDDFLQCICTCSSIAKANAIPWIEMALPKMNRLSSTNGGPTVFLDAILYGPDGLFSGLMKRDSDADVYLVYCLIMLYGGCKTAALVNPQDRHDLETKMALLNEMISHCVAARAMSGNGVLQDLMLLEPTPTPTTHTDKGSSSRRLITAFVSGPLAQAIDNNISDFLINPSVIYQLDQAFLTCFHDPLALVNGYGNRTHLMHFRYSPYLMFLADGTSKLVLLTLVIINCSPQYIPSNTVRIFPEYSLPFTALTLMLLSSVLYEYGLMEEKRWAVSPSIVFDNTLLEANRWSKVYNHFFEDIWKLFDLTHLLLLFLWLLTPSPLASIPLSLASIPLSLGLLRYISAFHRPFGTVILSIFKVASMLRHFSLIFAMTGLGFGIVLHSNFMHLHAFNTIALTFTTLTQAAFLNFDLTIFNDDSNSNSKVPPAFGAFTMVIFLIWTVAILFTTLVGYIQVSFTSVFEQSKRDWILIKAKHIQQHILTMEKSPCSMLPPPLNILPTVLYIPHVYNSWKARLLPSHKISLCLSIAGTACDILLAILLVLPASICECVLVLFEPGRSLDFFLLPFSLLVSMYSLLSQALTRPQVYLIVKSRIADGRLRVLYGAYGAYSAVECIGYVDRLGMGDDDDGDDKDRHGLKAVLKVSSSIGRDVRIAPIASNGFSSLKTSSNQHEGEHNTYSARDDDDGDDDESSMSTISKAPASIRSDANMHKNKNKNTNKKILLPSNAAVRDDNNNSNSNTIHEAEAGVEGKGDIAEPRPIARAVKAKRNERKDHKEKENASVCFPPHRFSRLFLPHERKLIFQKAIPEHFDEKEKEHSTNSVSSDLLQMQMQSLLRDVRAALMDRVDEVERREDV